MQYIKRRILSVPEIQIKNLTRVICTEAKMPKPKGTTGRQNENSHAASAAQPDSADGSHDPLHERLCERLRLARKETGWSLQQLSGASGVSRSMISQIERGKANPTLAVAYRLASALGLQLSELIEAAETAHAIDVIRADDPGHLFRDDQDCTVRTLSPLSLEKDVEFYQVTLKPGGRMDSAPHFRMTREFLTVEKGGLELQVGGETTRLSKGDSAQYPADQPHRLLNRGRGEAIIFLVVIYSNRVSAGAE